MKNTILAIILCSLTTNLQAQWEIRGSDNICSNTVYQLFFNGVLNSQQIVWEFTNYPNPNNQVLFSNQSNSSTSVSIVTFSNGCSPIQTVCCYPPTITLRARLVATNQIVAERICLLLSCSSFPITGQTSTIPFPNPVEPNGQKTTYTFFINGTIAQNGRNCYGGSQGYTTWVVSDNLKIEDLSWVTSNKIKVTRTGPGQAFIDLYFGDGRAYRKIIQ